jgi:predicted nucleic acid-binding protein
VSGFLIDANVISELIKTAPAPQVAAWVNATDAELIYISVITLGEIRKGISLLPQSKRRTRLEAWLGSDLLMRFAGRILDIDHEIADRWGQLSGVRGYTLPVIDGLLAATAIHHNLTLVTRNTRYVARTGVALFNPWSD